MSWGKDDRFPGAEEKVESDPSSASPNNSFAQDAYKGDKKWKNMENFSMGCPRRKDERLLMLQLQHQQVVPKRYLPCIFFGTVARNGWQCVGRHEDGALGIIPRVHQSRGTPPRNKKNRHSPP